MDPSHQPAHPGCPIMSSPHHPRPSLSPRPMAADVMESYRRFQLLHITHELVTCLEQLCSPDLPEHPHLLFHIVRGPLTSTSSTQTLLPNLVDQRTQTDGLPHAYIRPLSPALASPPSDSGPGTPDYIPSSPSDYGPGSPDYSPTSPSDY
ncbi:DNA-directed RNA polymerase II subunit RPB1-like [Tachysurus vachellii]|uniref:DNA-directed RNA polymerase II subunit RPB1-like n=1 Tax=Tachysurus vachellii TaxID=175792 RepID=UPI00296ACDE2|nr:DNA-directed RNA polymerase II subunit RPB1-like [Tachysurus vachellii]